MVEDEAYPGLETTVIGRFDYGQSPVPEKRNVEIYLDDILIEKISAGDDFSHKIALDPDMNTGTHLITVSAVAEDRYAPVVESAILNVTRTTPVVAVNTPTVALVPGRISLEGRLYSEMGPLSGAKLRMGFGKSEVELVSSGDGTFKIKIMSGMGFDLIGSQALEIQVIPQEPWHANLVTTKRIVTVNMISCGGMLAFLIVLGVFYPGGLKSRAAARLLQWRARYPAATAYSEPTRVYSRRKEAPSKSKERSATVRKPQYGILRRYRLVVRLAQRITKDFMKPQQTLREFAMETSGLLGPVGKSFIELTGIVERLLYSQHGASEEDTERSIRLSGEIEEGLKGEGV
jgi:hypothetical protein